MKAKLKLVTFKKFSKIREFIKLKVLKVTSTTFRYYKNCYLRV